MEDKRKIIDQLLEEERNNNSAVRQIQEYQARTILKLKKLIVSGHIPSRGAEEYSYITKLGQPAYSIINCFGHAVYNFTNSQLDKINFDENDCLSFRSFQYFDYDSEEIIATRMIKFIENCGLEIRPTQFRKILKNNQWKVALYFSKNFPKDFHLFLQESNFSWTSKIGRTNEVNHYRNLGKEYNNYEYYACYEITNPYANDEIIK